MPTSFDHNQPDPAARNKRNTLRRLFREHGPAVHQGLSGKIPARCQAVLSTDDVMQQTYTDAFLHIEQFVPKEDGSFRSWLSKIADNNLIDAVRMLDADKRGKGRRQTQPSSVEDSFAALYELLSTGAATPSQQAARKEAHAALQLAIEQLPELYRRVVQMFDLQGCSMEEVAKAVNRSCGAAYMIRARAHQRLQELMGNASKYFSSGG